MKEIHVRILLAACVVVLGVLFAGATKAQYYAEPPVEAPVVWYDGPNTPEGAVGVLIHINREVRGVPELHRVAVETPFGTITVLRADTVNRHCTPACPDPAHVETLPPGLYADPEHVLTPEGQSDWIVIYPQHLF